MNHFQEIFQECKGQNSPQLRARTCPGRRNHIDMVNMNSINFNSNHSAITAKPKTSSHKVIITVPYKVDTGTNGNKMPLHIHKKLFPRATKEQLAAARNTNIKLKTYN